MTAESPTILATCGGLDAGTWTDAVYGPLLGYAIELARVGSRRARVTHLNTAGGDQRFVEGQELEAARLAGADASHLRFFPRVNVPDPRGHLLESDVIWVSGGSLVNLLAVWRSHGLPNMLHEAWTSGVVIAGGSAGALCWHRGGTTASFGPNVTAVADGLGFVPGSLAVHWDSDASRRPAHLAAVGAGTLGPGFALEEGTGIRYSGTEFVEAVTQLPGKRAWRIADDATETALDTRLLAA